MPTVQEGREVEDERNQAGGKLDKSSSESQVAKDTPQHTESEAQPPDLRPILKKLDGAPSMKVVIPGRIRYVTKEADLYNSTSSSSSSEETAAAKDANEVTDESPQPNVWRPSLSEMHLVSESTVDMRQMIKDANYSGRRQAGEAGGSRTMR